MAILSQPQCVNMLFSFIEQIDKKAKELRAVAQRKRDTIAEMEARKNSSKRKRSRLEGELKNKKRELGK